MCYGCQPNYAEVRLLSDDHELALTALLKPTLNYNI